MTHDDGTPTLTPHRDLLFRRLGDAGVLVRADTGQIFELNRTGVRVWELLGEGRSVDAVIDALTGEFAQTRETIAADVQTLLAELRGQGLLAAG